jgi:hypothetical protein
VTDPELERYIRILGKDNPDVQRFLKAARGKSGTQIAKSVLRARIRGAKGNPDNNDPFAFIPSIEALGGSGPSVGFLADSGHELIWRHDEIPYSALFVGNPGFGKTSHIIRLLIQIAPYYTIIIPDLRGDYECLIRAIPNSRLFVFGEFPINLIRGSSRVPPAVTNQRFSEIFTDQFDLFQASRRYLNVILDGLEGKRLETGHHPCLPDLLDALEDRKEERGSDEYRFRGRCIARVDAICRALGEKCVGVEQGIDLERLIDTPQTLIFRIELEKSIQDFLVNWLVTYVFEHRTWSENKFSQKPLIFVLDEQRSLLRARR